MWPLLEGRATIAPDHAVLSSWREDPGPFHAIVLAINDVRVEERRARIGRAMHPWLLRSCPGQAHVTVAAVGPARPELPPPRQVELVVGGADSFASAAFLHAAGHDLDQLREHLAAQDLAAPAHFVAHVTVGTYRWPLAADIVAQRLAPWRHSPPLRVHGTVRLVRVDRSSRFGRLLPAEADPR
jgi:hypothetical protein